MLTRCLSLALTRNSRGGSKHPLYFASNTQIYGNKPGFKINRIYTFYLIGSNAKSDANCQQVRGLKSDKSHPAPELYGAQVGSDRVREQSLSLSCSLRVQVTSGVPLPWPPHHSHRPRPWLLCQTGEDTKYGECLKQQVVCTLN